jgi:predicted DNA binding CopG/RHH family protein
MPMKRNKKSQQIDLDHEEKELLSSFEKDEWKTIKNVEKGKVRARKTAAKTLRKDVRINIRLSSTDIFNIKQIAAFEGLPYQTLIASVLHKYAAGHLGLKI